VQIYSIFANFSKLNQNLGKIVSKFGQKLLDLGKITILHPQKHLIFYGCVLSSTNKKFIYR